MKRSVEVRWFCREQLPEKVREWFCSAKLCEEEAARTDHYLVLAGNRGIGRPPG